MTEATKTIITAAIAADQSMTQSAKDIAIRYLTSSTHDDSPAARFLSERQAGFILGVSVRTIRRMKHDGELQTKKIHGSKKITAESVYSY